MLVLSRDCDTVVKIGDGIRIKVLSIRRQRVKLGVEAPKDVRVWREEVSSNNRDANSADTHPTRVDTTFDTAEHRNVCTMPILVVEGNPTDAARIQKILADNGCDQVTVLASGTKTVQRLLQSREDRDNTGRRPVGQLSASTCVGE